MATLQEQLTALEEAINQGVLTVEYADKKVTYRSLNEMLQIKDNLQAQLGVGSRRRFLAKYSKGT